MANDKLSKFHEALLQNPNAKGIPADYAKFEAAFNNPEMSEKLYSALKANPSISGLPDDINVFYESFGLKKKVGTEESASEAPSTSQNKPIDFVGEALGKNQPMEPDFGVLAPEEKQSYLEKYTNPQAIQLALNKINSETPKYQSWMKVGTDQEIDAMNLRNPELAKQERDKYAKNAKLIQDVTMNIPKENLEIERQRTSEDFSEFMYGFREGKKASQQSQDDAIFIAQNADEPQKNINYLEDEFIRALARTQNNPELLTKEGLGNLIGGQFSAIIKAGAPAMLVSLIGTPVAGAAVGGTIGAADAAITGFGAALRQSYYELRAQGSTPEEAYDKALTLAYYGAGGGAFEGALGAIPMFGKLAGKLVTKPITQELTRAGIDMSVDMLAAGTSQIVQNKAAQKQGIERGTFDGVKENMLAEGLFSAGMNIGSGIVKTPGAIRDYANNLTIDKQQKVFNELLKMQAETEAQAGVTISDDFVKETRANLETQINNDNKVEENTAKLEALNTNPMELAVQERDALQSLIDRGKVPDESKKEMDARLEYLNKVVADFEVKKAEVATPENVETKAVNEIETTLNEFVKTNPEEAKTAFPGIELNEEQVGIISNDYQKAKEDGTNPELVNKVEQLLNQKQDEKQVQQTEGQGDQEVIPTTEPSRAEKRKVREEAAKARLSETLGRLSNIKEIDGNPLKKGETLNDLMSVVEDLATLGVIQVEKGVDHVIDQLKKNLPNITPTWFDDIKSDLEEDINLKKEELIYTREKAKAEFIAKGMEVTQADLEAAKITEPEEGFGKKMRKSAERLLKDESLQPEVREGLSKDAVNYIPKSGRISQYEADVIVREKGAEQAAIDVMDLKNDMTPDVRIRLASSLLDEFGKRIDKARSEGNKVELDKAIKQSINITEKIMEFGTELGRGVQAFTALSKVRTDVLRAKIIKDIEKAGVKLTAEQMSELDSLVNRMKAAPEGFQKFNAMQDLMRWQMGIKDIEWVDVAMAVWYSHILSGYSTQMVNFIANFGEIAGELTSSAIYNPKNIPFLFKSLFDGWGRGLYEAMSVLKTGYEINKGGAAEFKNVGQPSVLEILKAKQDAKGSWNPLKYHPYVQRFMSAADTFMYHGLKEMRSAELILMEQVGKGKTYKEAQKIVNEKLFKTKDKIEKARRKAVSEFEESSVYNDIVDKYINQEVKKRERSRGKFKTADERNNFIESLKKSPDYKDKLIEQYKKDPDYKRRVFEIMEQARDEKNTDNANDFASRGTFNYRPEGRIGHLAEMLATGVNDFSIFGVKALKFIVPFTRIVSNVANRYVDYSPYGFVRAAKGSIGSRKGGKYSRKYTREERAKEFIKAGLGTTAMTTLYALSAPDEEGKSLIEITANGTGDTKANFNLMETGWQRYSIKIGDNWYSYINTPLAIPLTIIGNIRDLEKYRNESFQDEEFIKKFEIVMYNSMRFITDMTFLKGLSEFMTTFTDNNVGSAGSYFEKFAKSTAKGFVVPNIATQTSRKIQDIYDMPMKKVDGIWENMYRDIPFARQGLSNMVNALGEDISPDTDRLWSEENDDPIWNFIVENKAWIRPPNRNSKYVDIENQVEVIMSEEELYEYTKLRGKILKQAIKENFTELKKLPPDQVRKAVSDMQSDAGKMAKYELFYNK